MTETDLLDPVDAAVAAAAGRLTRPPPGEPVPTAVQMATQAPAALAVPGPALLGRGPKLDGAAILDRNATFLYNFAYWPSKAALVAAALFGAGTNARIETSAGKSRPAPENCAKLLFTAPDGGYGKSRMSMLTSKLCPNPKRLVEPSKAALVKIIAKGAVVVLTEAELAFGPTGTKNSTLSALLNASYEPEITQAIVQGGKELETELLSWSILDGLDAMLYLPALRTLMSRCIIVHCQKAPEGYKPERFDDAAREIAAILQQETGQWIMQEVRDGMAKDRPKVPDWLGNRPFALWEWLFTVAGRAGGQWPELCWQACVDLETAAFADLNRDAKARADEVVSGWAQPDFANWNAEPPSVEEALR